MLEERSLGKGCGSPAHKIVSFLDQDAFPRAYREYSTGDALSVAREAFQEHLGHVSAGAGACLDAVNAFDGVEQMPLMTVHKGNGLEYDTTIFVGLDDESWWAHTPGKEEGLATFFVALSRAKQRAIFSYCDGRGRRKVRNLYFNSYRSLRRQ